jgi:predicted transposase YdaD
MLDAFDEGKMEGKLEIAKKMLEKGMDVNFIIETTGLNKGDIEKL